MTIRSLLKKFVNVFLRTDKTAQDLPERVNWRIRNLCEKLFEVIVHHWLELRQACERRVISHRSQRFLLVFEHRNEKHLNGFGCITVKGQPGIEKTFGVLQTHFTSQPDAPVCSVLQQVFAADVVEENL